MPIISREMRDKERERILHLLKQGLATKRIMERLGVSEKKVSRARKLLQTMPETPRG